MSKPDVLDKSVQDGLQAVAKSGLTDKMDWKKAAKVAAEMGFDETAEWIRKEPTLYRTVMFEMME